MKLHIKATRTKRGAALVEYGLLVAGVAVVALAAVAVLGNKVGDLFATSAAVLPGAHEGDNAPIATGQIATTTTIDGVVTLETNPESINTIGENLGVDLSDLVIDTSGNSSGN